jgi:ribose/xylose/arabinose/galactoside ABC-type transport system permease subunit
MVRLGLVTGIVAGIAAGIAVGLANGLIIARLRVNPFTMVLVRGVVYLITGGAPVGDEGLPPAFIASAQRGFWESITWSGFRLSCLSLCPS